MTSGLRHRLSAAAVRAGRRPLERQSGPVRLDGGASTSLAARGHDLTGPMWSARLLRDAPDAVRAVHADFLAAGAELITTIGYQLAAESVRSAGGDPARTPELLRRSVQLARQAVDASPIPALVGASVGPYGAVLADGSEYRGGYRVERARLTRFHRERLEVLADTDVDVLVCETIPSARELEVLAEVLADLDVPAIVSVTLSPDATSTAEGQPLREAFAPVIAVASVAAIGVNCVPQSSVHHALRALAGLGLPLLAAPNTEHEPLGDPRVWIDAGAQLVGGCCGTDADDLRVLFSRCRDR